MILTSITSYFIHKYVLWANKWCSIILWYHPRCLLHSWPNIVTLWATIATHLWEKMIKNEWKQVFDNSCLHDFLFYTQVCSMGQQVVFNYPMVSPKGPTTLKTPYRYPMGHYSHSFVTKYSQKLLKNMFYLHNILCCTQICSIGQWVVWNHIMISPKAPLTLMTPYSYPMGHYGHSFVSKNGQKWFNHLRQFSLTNKWLWCPIG
jgi:hypothetical protein